MLIGTAHILTINNSHRITGCSTKTALQLLLDNIYSTLLISLDLSVAFDTIDHAVLLKRLNCSFGITGTVYSWLCPTWPAELSLWKLVPIHLQLPHLQLVFPKATTFLYLHFTYLHYCSVSSCLPTAVRRWHATCHQSITVKVPVYFSSA